MAKVRKKHNPQQRAARMAHSALQHVAVSYVTGDDYCELVDVRTGAKQQVSRALAGCVENFTYRWSILIAAFGRDAQGQDYMKSEIVQTQQPYYQRDLAEVLNVEHSRLIGGFNQSQLLGAGWLASPMGVDWTEQQAFDLFHKLGAFQRVRDAETGVITVTEEVV